MTKKIITLAVLVVAMTAFSFTTTKTKSSLLMQRVGVNYIFDEPCLFTDEHDLALDALANDGAEVKAWYESNGELDFFIVKCHSSFQHGVFLGSGCCTSPPPTPTNCPSYIRGQIEDIQASVDAIMSHYE